MKVRGIEKLDGGTIKRCGRCARWLKVNRETFQPNRCEKVSPHGLQHLCRECDTRRRSQDIGYAWQKFSKVLIAEGLVSEWTIEMYARLREKDECHWCGALLSEWGQGHNVDRIDSHRKHVPNNCVPCCSACNWSKGHDNVESWLARTLKPLLADHGRGKIPWAKIFDNKGPKRVAIPDLSKHVVLVTEQTELPL
jgi:hypothetical protein